jgi:hypothetical protein
MSPVASRLQLLAELIAGRRAPAACAVYADDLLLYGWRGRSPYLEHPRVGRPHISRSASYTFVSATVTQGSRSWALSVTVQNRTDKITALWAGFPKEHHHALTGHLAGQFVRQSQIDAAAS